LILWLGGEVGEKLAQSGIRFGTCLQETCSSGLLQPGMNSVTTKLKLLLSRAQQQNMLIV